VTTPEPDGFIHVQGDWSPVEIAEFQQHWNDAAKRHRIAILPPPRWPTADELRQFLRDNVTIVKPGETLIIRVPENWSPDQAVRYEDAMNAADETGTPVLPFRTQVVAGLELGIAEAGGNP
jgi:hypothetical protein